MDGAGNRHAAESNEMLGLHWGSPTIFISPRRSDSYRASNQHVATMLFGQTMNPTLSPILAYPTQAINNILSLPLVPHSTLPFNLLFTLNALRLNLEYSKAQRGAERGYLQVIASQ
jgi:hypothetical protein